MPGHSIAPSAQLSGCPAESRQHARIPLLQHRPQLWSRHSRASRRALEVSCRSKRGRDNDRRESRKEFIRIKIGPLDLSVTEDTIWSVALPAAGFLALSAFIGPLIIAIAASALALGAAMSAGAMAAALFFPLFAVVGLTMLTMGGFTFGTVAAVGLGIVLPKIISMVIAISGIALGWVAVNYLTSKSKATIGGAKEETAYKDRFSTGESSGSADVEVDERVREMARELRDFDMELAQREEKRRLEQWRRDSRQ